MIYSCDWPEIASPAEKRFKEDMSISKEKPTLLAWAIVMIAGAAAYRVASGLYLTSLPNFSPAMAMAFCAGLALTGALAYILPLGCLFVSDLLLNAHFGQPLIGNWILASYACYLAAIALGQASRGRGWLPLLGVTLGNGVLFYVVTNTFSWWGDIHYAQTFAGWWQALTVGRPGFPPTWTFFRNSIASDLIFTVFFLAVFRRLARPRAVAEPLRRTS